MQSFTILYEVKTCRWLTLLCMTQKYTKNSRLEIMKSEQVIG